SFVESVASYAGMNLDVVLIECSGLAKPTPLVEIMDQVMAASDRGFDYAGMICLLDAESYEDLADVVNAVDEQLFFSDCFIINKTDLVDAETLERIRRKIRLYHPDAPIYETSYAEVDASVLDFRRADAAPPEGRPEWAGWGEKGRPITCTFRPPGPLKEVAVRGFLEAMTPHAWRIKGLLRLESGMWRIDCVGTDIQIRLYHDQDDSITGGLVLISKIGLDIKPLADAAWLKCVSVS
ncbi:MAG: GTP-binding protein, partial [Kiritimatiellae bacterium]|nr:GTP-binding protein [Kiritimatiellia bacterium]